MQWLLVTWILNQRNILGSIVAVKYFADPYTKMFLHYSLFRKSEYESKYVSA